jgi:hypothetical protein
MERSCQAPEIFSIDLPRVNEEVGEETILYFENFEKEGMILYALESCETSSTSLSGDFTVSRQNHKTLSMFHQARSI